MVNQQNHEESNRDEVVGDQTLATEATEAETAESAGVAETAETPETVEGTETRATAEASVQAAAPEVAEADEAGQSEGEQPAADQAEAALPETQPEPTPEPEPEPAETKPETPQLVLPFSEMSPEERFRATTRLIFLAPDVPPVPIRPRREDLRELDDLLDQRFTDDRVSTDRGAQGRSSNDRGAFDDDRDQGAGRRRGRRRNGDSAGDDDAQRRPARQAPVITEPQKVKGSTRLEAKRQRRRDGRDAGRRRTVITESEFLARREAVDRQMVVRSSDDRIQIGVLEDKVLVEHYVARSSESSLIGNIYLGRVQNVLPSMEAAFVDIGKGRNAVLYSGEVDWSEFEGAGSARRIENALKPGDPVLVQVTKDPVGHKGARLTSQISLPGRFLVYVPGGAMNGISRKLPDTERARLKKILKEVLPSGAGVIVRTAAEGASEDQLTHDVERLTRQWESIQKRTQKGGGPSLLHSEPDMLIKIVRDVFNEDFHRLVISGADTHGVIENYLQQVAPDLLQRVELYEGERDIFDEYRVSEQIAKALDRKVWLPSGGSLVIDRTEAMTVVDVNTGKFVGSGGNLEETVTKNNLEAAEEIVRQLRLRDIGGIIVVDFIDMVLESNRDLVLRRLVECLSRDRTKHQVAEVTSLGLVQMTRKKLGLGLLESFSEPCDTCAGRGIIVHHEPVHRHRGGDNGGSSRKRKSGGSQQQGQQPAQTHAISNGAKNMLAQVAASTIGGQKGDAEEGEQPQAAEPTQAREQAETREQSASGGRGGSSRDSQNRQSDGREPQGGTQSKRGSRRVSKPQAADTPVGEVPVIDIPAIDIPASVAGAAAQDPAGGRAAEPAALLDSVLDALPDAPSAGKGRARRRATAPQTRVDSGSSAPAADAAQAARQALADALDATARERDAEKE